MKFAFIPKTDSEKFALKVYFSLVENFSRTYLVGGTVRDLLLGKKITDIDIATQARPNEVVECLKKHFIDFNIGFIRHGVVIASQRGLTAAIATFRKDLRSSSRYPKIKYVKSAKEDSQRLDFTINSFYFSPKNQKILDFHNGFKDLKNKSLRFIGKSEKRIKEDPLRIIRALRFCLLLSFTLEKNTKKAIQNNFNLVNTLTKNKIRSELEKLTDKSLRKILETVLRKPELLDKRF